MPTRLVFTDPDRTPDPIALAKRLPPKVALVYRAFGAGDAEAVGRRLLEIARRRNFSLLIGADSRLAARIGADGVHLPQRLAHLAARVRRPGWLITAAAHSGRAARVRYVDAVVLSTVFASASRSAGKPMGPLRLAQIVRETHNPVYALGGVREATAAQLLRTGIVGVAGVEDIRT